MAVPDTTSNDPVHAVRAWLENVAESHATGSAAEPAPPQVREVWVSIDPPPQDGVPIPSTTPPTALHPRGPRPRFIWEATLQDGRTVTVAREVTDEQMGLA
ncbi:hypothetical protein [Nonomuraea candida]|uniref:hypothetical protein n=1 Tax=Nonomuraea candida TaxID=359159 RepID=UPI0005B8C7E8|nr:hypothetical protein [Nonomuraea candida]